MTASDSSVDTFATLRDLFGDNRAEWPTERFRELFVEPAYFRKLEVMRPSILVGGRGTGKSTVLRSLRFDATLERLEAQGRSFGDQEHVGIFVRVNKNRVHAFHGASIDTDIWRKAFAHYFNLLACTELSQLAQWLELRLDETLSSESVRRICRDLAIPEVETTSDLLPHVRDSISTLQIFVNNPESSNPPLFSMAESPLRTFASALSDHGLLEGRIIFCCVDEYENLLDYQQAVLNTYIKHAEPPLSFKVGVRKNGLRTRQTIVESDLLQTPDDYQEIDIANEGFEYFATAVAKLRLSRAKQRGAQVPESLDQFLEGLSFAEEASHLGADSVADKVLEELKENSEVESWFASKPKSETYFLKYWAESEGSAILDLALHWMNNEKSWKDRVNNYGYASLFWLSRGRRGARVRKYYCGARTLLALPAGNIRYFLELIDNSVAHQLKNGSRNPTTPLRISSLAQTRAARDVGQRRLKQLEGLAEHGVELKRLVLAIGKVFFELARRPLGRTPEVTSFVLGGKPADVEKATELLDEGAAYLAFEATPRTKATTEVEMRDDEYRLHPIFCAFFEISHRRKRRLTFDAGDLLYVLKRPSKAIFSLLDSTSQTKDADLPEQLAFFSSFYEGGETE